MKRLVNLFAVALAIVASAACTKFDDSDILNRLGNLESRVSSLENSMKQLSDYQSIKDKVNSGVVITSAAQASDGKSYTLKFSDGSTMTITNGIDGVNGKDGKDGKDGVDGKNGADGKDGKDGVDGKDGKDGTNGTDGATPSFKITDGMWYVSYDNGATWAEVGSALDLSLFQNVTVDGDYLVITLADGTIIRLAIVYNVPVDLGLSVKWSNCNLGARTATDYGLYYSWGETTGYLADGSDGKTFSWGEYKWCQGTAKTQQKYNLDPNYGTVDNKTILDPEDDAAAVALGGSWRMPTKAEFEELMDSNNCEWTWTTIDGVNGCKVQSKIEGYTDNWIFLPFAGTRTAAKHDGDKYSGYYYASELKEKFFPYQLYMYNKQGTSDINGKQMSSSMSRFKGNSIRPVCK